MFFYLSKIIGFFVVPSNFLCVLVALGFLLLKTRFERAGRWMMTIAMVSLLIGGFSPLGNILLVPLEDRFAQPARSALPKAPYGIIILGGSISTVISRARGTVAVNESAERLLEGVRLAHRFPGSRLLFSGGHGRLIFQSMSEADVAQSLFAQMKIAPQRLIFERKSKNTWQNARYTRDLLGEKAQKNWILITSAFHMARSVGCFQKAGINVIPWPVDHRTRGKADFYRTFDVATNGWRRLDVAVREWVGLVAYRLTGRTNELFPGPRSLETGS